jgi:uncharacterized protein (DUF924 family)
MDLSNVLAFWFGELDGEGLADAAHSQLWWRKDPEFDAQIRERFSGLWQRLTRESDVEAKTPEEELARVIVLDQFSRNMFRDQGAAFSADAQALGLARAVSERGDDRSLRGHHRVFLYMPFMHSEALADQDRCIALFTAFHDQSEAGRLRAELAQNIGFAQRHRDIIARFGRFPHRNQLLGRASSAEEKTFLTQPGSSF